MPTLAIPTSSAGGRGARSSSDAAGSGSRTDAIRFKAEASAWTPNAVQLQQVWVEPGLRGRGYAREAMADLCALLLEQGPTVCLFARSDNLPALRLYEAVGMRRTITYRSLIFS